ncbi:DHA2 family efflux MFS transporter permease subunit [Pseudactinotalea sp. HY160]|uniref:DHA2 family efflux MFS transporter permease subunit n=1 Tax=Pseudactinotalea sp. HY160 TaxID=2654490 RepID=UPI00128BF2FC|nr:DHA2 family efflux MFS transporter permease subunit [Pseudactinotalea sp. HY160]MPV48451.1 DHA2 family efflux MFS transporter permease subunit [Pseudactinotalea sp. HY160]
MTSLRLRGRDHPVPALEGRRRWLALTILAAGVAMIVIDGTIVNVSLPVLIRDLDLDLTDAEWVNSIYTLIFASLLLTTGTIGDRYGRRRVFAAGVVVFVAGSLWAGFATGGSSLIGARALQGLGGAAILPSTLSVVNALFRGRDRAIAFAVWGSVIAGTAAVGPLLGGWLTTDVSWRWIFWVNLPVGAAILAGILLVIPETRDPNPGRGFDVTGVVLSAITFGGLVLGLIEGNSYGWWVPRGDFHLAGLSWSLPLSMPATALLVAAASLVAFIAWQRHRRAAGRAAVVDLALFRHRSFGLGNAAALLVALGEFGMLFVLPLYLQNALGLSAMGAGWVLAGLGAGAFVAGGIAGPLARRITPAGVASVGLAIETVGLVLVALVVGPATSPALIAVLLAGYGIGLGFASAQLTGTILSEIPPARSGQGSAVQSTTRQLGSALGVAVLASILSAFATSRAAGSLAGIDGVGAAQAARLESSLGPSAGGVLGSLDRLGLPAAAQDQVHGALTAAFSAGVQSTMLVAAIALAVGFAATLFLPRIHGGEAGDGTGGEHTSDPRR